MKRLNVIRLGLPAALLVGVGLVMAGCKKQTASGPSATPPPSVRIGYFANFTHAQAVLGVSSGEFQQAVGASKVETKVFNAGPSLIEALNAGEIDIGYVGPGPALNGFDKSHGKSLRIIAGAASNGVVIVARKDSGINALTDLPGKKIATPQQGNTQDIAARHYLKSELKQSDLSNVRPVPNAEQVGLMQRGEIDAAWAPEPWGSLLVAQTGAKLVGAEKDLWAEGSFAITVVITTPEFLAKHPDVVEKILGVHVAWTERLNQEPEKYLPELEKALFALTNKKLPPGVMKSALANTTFTNDPQKHTFDKFAQWTYDLGFAKQVPNVTGLIDTATLTKVQAARPAALASSKTPSATTAPSSAPAAP